MVDREGDWDAFQQIVTQHIRHYANKQYSNPDGDEQIESYTTEDCAKVIMRYCARVGKGARGATEQLRDCYKIAHYAQFLHDKLQDELGHIEVYPTV